MAAGVTTITNIAITMPAETEGLGEAWERAPGMNSASGFGVLTVGVREILLLSNHCESAIRAASGNWKTCEPGNLPKTMPERAWPSNCQPVKSRITYR